MSQRLRARPGFVVWYKVLLFPEGGFRVLTGTVYKPTQHWHPLIQSGHAIAKTQTYLLRALECLRVHDLGQRTKCLDRLIKRHCAVI